MTEIPTSVRPLFIAAGWYPGRWVEVSPDVPASHPAAAILAEFVGLKAGQSGAGEECASSDVAFQKLGADGSLVRLWCELLRTRLVGVAEVHNAHGELYVDGSGRWFEISLMDDEFYFIGSSFGEAMERLLLGRRARPMLRPDQERVTMYGEIFTANHPRLYKYR